MEGAAEGGGVEKQITLKSRKLSVENVTPEPKDVLWRFLLLSVWLLLPLSLLLLVLLLSLKYYE